MKTNICQCGCGELCTNLYKRGHFRKGGVLYLEEDCGYETPCWIWQRGIFGGYGRITRSRVRGLEGKTGGSKLAHRVFYEEQYGAIQEGMVLDHLCENTMCVNPDHCEPVSQAENTRRGAERIQENWHDLIFALLLSVDKLENLGQDTSAEQKIIARIKRRQKYNPRWTKRYDLWDVKDAGSA